MAQKNILLVSLIFIIFQVVHASDDPVNTTILWSAKEMGAVCLDGTPPVYNFAPGYGDGAESWMIFLEGGAWCHSNDSCYGRFIRKGEFPGCGSSTCKTAAFFVGILNESNISNPDFYNWNRVYIRYCDGASFAGDIEEPISYNGSLIYRRGARIFNAMMEALLPLGMEHASNALLTGSSAGGLAATLHCDRFKNYLPFATRLKCISGDGFFIHGKDLPKAYYRELLFAEIINYHGIDKFLPISCTSVMDPLLCLFPENLVGYIETPLFILNSAFDEYQIMNHLDPGNPEWFNCTKDLSRCNITQIQIMKDFRTSFLQALPKFTPSNGVFIDSCYTHNEIFDNSAWDNFIVNNKTMVKAVGDWFYERSNYVYDIDIQDYPINCTKL